MADFSTWTDDDLTGLSGNYVEVLNDYSLKLEQLKLTIDGLSFVLAQVEAERKSRTTAAQSLGDTPQKTE